MAQAAADSVQKKHKTFYEMFVKRFLDIVLSLLALIVLSPLLLIIAILSKIFIRGKVIFAQCRPGKNGKLFKLYKFKSMTDKTDANGNLLPDAERITKFGKFLRKFSLDELPQLINILRGDMSIIGPRPRLVADMVFYDREVLPGYRVRPGLTGLDQVCGGRSVATWEMIFANNLKYQQKVTFWGDVKIIFMTIGTLFKADSAAAGAGQTQREYYYADYLLKHNKITKAQYNLGHARAKEIIATMGSVQYQPDLQPQKGEEPCQTN